MGAFLRVDMRLPRSRANCAPKRLFWALLVGTILAVAYRWLVIDATDPYRCNALLTQGEWLDAPDRPYLERPFQRWQPPRCMLHEYHASGLTGCFKSRRVIIAGDSTTRQIYWAVAKKLDRGRANRESSQAPKQEDLIFKHNDVELNFVWDPFLNSSRLHNELLQYQKAKASLKEPGKAKKSPALIMIGGGLWHARFVQHDAVTEFQTAMDTIASMLALPSSDSKQFPLLSGHQGSDDLAFIMPVESPLYDQLSPSRTLAVTPEKIDAMNQYLYQLSKRPGLEIMWSYRLMTHNEPEAYGESGFHVVEHVANRRADVVLNLRCNAGANAKGTYPMDRTCCSGYRSPNWIQVMVLVGLTSIFSLLYCISRRNHKAQGLAVPPSVVGSVLVILSALLYCFFADRTRLFTKLQKYYSPGANYVLGGLIVFLGLFSVRRAPAEGVTSAKQRRAMQKVFLPSEIADEWKGLIVAIALAYRLTEAWKVIWAYEAVRLITASYLFLASFEHTSYFYSTRDYSLRRVASVLFRINLLSLILPFTMGTDYLFYPFAPLLSFWFMVVFTIMRVGSSLNENAAFLLGKIIVCGTLFTLVIFFPGPLNFISSILKYTCHISWNIEKFRLRLNLDLLVVYAGMITALIYVRLSKTPKHMIQGRERLLHLLIQRHFQQLRILFVLLAVNILIAVGVIVHVAPNTEDYNTWMRWFSFLPAISFAVLRNSHHRLRTVRSTVLAWLGRCSVEAFTLQYHIWMAGDGKGILSLGLFGPNYGWSNNGRWEEFVIISVLFLCLCGYVSNATSMVTWWFICGNDEQNVAVDPLGVSEVHATMDGDDAVSNRKQSMDLPTIRDSETNGFSHAGSANGHGLISSSAASPARGKSPLKNALSSKLKTRIITSLVVMWLCNWLYN